MWYLTAATQDEAVLSYMKAGYTHAEAPVDLLRFLSLKLKTGWRFDRSRRQFVSTGGQRLSILDQLPEGSDLVPTVPTLAKADPTKLSDTERDLARYFQLILPKGATPEDNLRVVKRCDAVEEVTLPPKVSLP
jgi:hypothetical protein